MLVDSAGGDQSFGPHGIASTAESAIAPARRLKREREEQIARCSR
jgi:hypothetical protein